MKKETLILIGAALIVFLIILIAFFSSRKQGQDNIGAGAPITAPAVDFQQRINILQDIVKKTPTNRSAWVQMGNLYFDSGQPEKSIEAYGRALELDPNDPNILTDQGVMYRQLGRYDRALENFQQAQRVDPSHAQSLYNIGVVYRIDLKDFTRAREAWEKYLEINPVGPRADQVRSELEFMQALPTDDQ